MGPNELNDIIDGCKNKNSRAQEALYKHYFAMMYNVCKRYSENKQTIINLVNEGFLKIFMSISSFDASKGSFESWAKKIMNNTSIDYVRSKKNSNKIIILNENTIDQQLIPETNPDYIEENVMKLIENMAYTTREVFVMHIFKGYSHKEIAEMLGISESTSRWHVSEVRKKLRLQTHKIY